MYLLSLPGGMQDYNYVMEGCMETTLEVSCCKFPPTDELQTLWLENKAALLGYLNLVHMGKFHMGIREFFQKVISLYINELIPIPNLSLSFVNATS